jgi:hypothetical protein
MPAEPRTDRPASRLQQALLRCGAFATMLACALLASPALLADPGDFQAMPGLWKLVLRTDHSGRPGPATVAWRCVYEDADPWAAFASLAVPGHAQCARSGERRSSTALAWNLACPGTPPARGRGRVDFDSAKHYTASITLDGGEALHVEGRRYAACTSPAD